MWAGVFSTLRIHLVVAIFEYGGGQALNLHIRKTGSLAAGSGHGFGACGNGNFANRDGVCINEPLRKRGKSHLLQWLRASCWLNNVVRTESRELGLLIC